MSIRSFHISIATTIIGATIIVLGIINLCGKNECEGIAEIVVGAFIIAFGWLLVTVAIYLLAVALIVYGAFKVFFAYTFICGGAKGTTSFLPLLSGLVNIALGILLFFDMGGTVDWIFIVSGAVLIAEGAVCFIDSVRSKPVPKKEDGESVKTEDGSEFRY